MGYQTKCEPGCTCRKHFRAYRGGPACSVPGCPHLPLKSGPCCYGHTVDDTDPRHIPTEQFDGSGGGSDG